MELAGARPGDDMSGKVLAFSAESRPAAAMAEARDDDDWMLLARSGREGTYPVLRVQF